MSESLSEGTGNWQVTNKTGHPEVQFRTIKKYKYW